MNTPAAPASPMAAPETAVWRGTPSQVINLPQYLLWGLIFVVLLVSGVTALRAMDPMPTAAVVLLVVVAAVPWIVSGWKWLVTASILYELTTQRLRIRTGVFNKHLDELELYRVRDYRLEQPFFLRLFSLSTVILQTSDRSSAVIVLRAIRKGESLREQMRTYVEEARMRRGVREVDID